MFFLLFLTAAVLVFLAFPFAERARVRGRVRSEGLLFVTIVTVVGLAGLSYLTLSNYGSPVGEVFTTPDALKARPLVPDAFLRGVQLWLLVLAVYVLSVLRRMAGLPLWISDLLVLGAGFLAVRSNPDILLSIPSSLAPDSPTLQLGAFTTVLTVAWIWLVSRLCATLSRVRSVPSGYLGLVAGLIFLLMGASGAADNVFAPCATTALAGAGFMAFVISLRFPDLHIGWSSTLSMGFLIGITSATVLLKNTLPVLVGLALFTLLLPLLDVILVQVRAKFRGEIIDLSRSRHRLHQLLASRGVPTRKIALLYFFLGLWGCSLAYFLNRWTTIGRYHPLISLLCALFFLIVGAGGVIGFYSIGRLLMRRVAGEFVPENIEAFGVKISTVSMQEALDKIEQFIAQGTPHHVLTSDANAILTSRSDADYAAIMRRAALVTPDGFGVIWGVRLLNLPIYERVTGVDMVTGICERAAQNGYRIFILGAEEGVAATAAQKLTERYPGLQVVGTHHGFWRRDDKAAGLSVEESDCKMADEVAAHRPDVLFVAMGIPMQEKFIAAQLQRMKAPVALGVGGSFDVYAGKFNRAPQYVQRVGLEWLYRVWIDPSRWKRMGYVPRFMLVALKTWILRPKNSAISSPDVL